jgi:hypothetical protein
MRHFIPIVNQVERLLPLALSGCVPLWPCTTIIDNRDTPEELAINLRELAPGVNIYRPCQPLTTAQTMNLMLMLCTRMGVGFFTWQHLDAVPQGDTAKQLPAIAQEATDRGIPWGVIFTHYDCFAAVNVAALNAIEGWDWRRFPYYFLDNDIHLRLVQAGYQLIDTGLPCTHEGSSTNQDPERRAISAAYFQASQRLWLEKYHQPSDIPMPTLHWPVHEPIS